MAHDVVSIGNPLMDILIEVEEEFLKELGLAKGNMHLMDEKQINQIEKKLEKLKKKFSPGGSEANTLTALSMLGHRVVYFGKVGQDPNGDNYHQKLIENGVMSKVIKVNGMTGRAITFITPDSERTFATHLGVAPLFEGSELNEADIIEAKFLHITGYLFYSENTKKAALQALNIAKNNNVKICLDLADPNCVKVNKDILKQVTEEYVDIIIANENEAKEFTGQEPEQAVDTLSKLVEIAIVKIGAKGSLIKSKDKLIKIPGIKIKAVDTTGAGDIYTAGFLYGLLNDLDLETSGKIASFIAAKVCEVKGARLDNIPIEEINRLKMSIQDNIKKIRREIPSNIKLVAATKKRTTEEIKQAISAGIQIIGENYVQEAENKYKEVKGQVKIHCIGHLQTNKVKKAVEIFDMIQTVDSIKIAKEINKRCKNINKIILILVEINSGKEPNKDGAMPEDAINIIKEASKLKNIKIKGLMTMAPLFKDPEKDKPYFKLTKKLFDKIKSLYIPNVDMGILSMGMTHSYKIAIEEGANMIRIGTKIFNVR